ncbi:hypothetical protein BGW80DRAFT_1272410 [Lactifluus volemus]|nr:hypothetical protein BGW80DRAFT_1272410 [Lactifluus volemus]
MSRNPPAPTTSESCKSSTIQADTDDHQASTINLMLNRVRKLVVSGTSGIVAVYAVKSTHLIQRSLFTVQKTLRLRPTFPGHCSIMHSQKLPPTTPPSEVALLGRKRRSFLSSWMALQKCAPV